MTAWLRKRTHLILIAPQIKIQPNPKCTPTLICIIFTSIFIFLNAFFFLFYSTWVADQLYKKTFESVNSNRQSKITGRIEFGPMAVRESLLPLLQIRTESAVHGSLHPLLKIRTKSAVRGSLHSLRKFWTDSTSVDICIPFLKLD